MPALVVAGVTIPGVVSAPRTIEEGIDRERAFDGSLLATRVATEKSSWSFQCTHLTAAQVTTVEAALDDTPPLTCSGDLLGGSKSCFVERHGVEPVLGITPTRFMLSFSLLLA